jgi:4-aminobutyrate aminotransferase
MKRAFEDRILAERARMRSSVEDLLQRVEEQGLGERSKEIMRQTLEYESLGHLYFGLFQCAPVLERAKGARVRDVDGNEFVDFHSGFAVNNLGHANEEVNAAITEQMAKMLQFAELPCQVRADYAREIVHWAPGDFPKKVQFTVTGGEAVEVAMKLSRWYTGKPMIVTHFGDYHGRTMGAMALTSKAPMYAYYYPIQPADSGIIRFPFAYCYRCPYGKEYPSCDIQCAKAIEDLFKSKEAPMNNPAAGITNVAAFIIEPFQSSAGYIIPPPEFHQRLKALCDELGILFVSDEIQAGMGRSGKMWAIEHSDVVPDMITVAKSLSNGLPISATIGRKEIMDSWGPGAHCTTFAGYPVGCAGGLKVLEIYRRDKIVENVAHKGKVLAEGLADLQERHSIIGTYDSKGFYAAIELVRDRKTKEPAGQEAEYAVQSALQNGLICMHTGYYYNRLCFAPPLISTEDDLREGLRILDEVLSEVEEKFGIA